MVIKLIDVKAKKLVEKWYNPVRQVAAAQELIKPYEAALAIINELIDEGAKPNRFACNTHPAALPTKSQRLKEEVNKQVKLPSTKRRLLSRLHEYMQDFERENQLFQVYFQKLDDLNHMVKNNREQHLALLDSVKFLFPHETELIEILERLGDHYNDLFESVNTLYSVYEDEIEALDEIKENLDYCRAKIS